MPFINLHGEMSSGMFFFFLTHLFILVNRRRMFCATVGHKHFALLNKSTRKEPKVDTFVSPIGWKASKTFLWQT